MGKSITIDQSHNLVQILANNIDWESLDNETVQEIISTPHKSGSHLTQFLKNNGRLSFGVKETPNLKLVASNIVIPPLVGLFDPQDCFIHKGRGVEYELEGEFEKHILNPTKPFSNLPGMSLSTYQLKHTTDDRDIYSEIGITGEKFWDKESLLWVIAYLTSLQPTGQDGILLAKYFLSNFFGYVEGANGKALYVSLVWNSRLQKYNAISYSRHFSGNSVVAGGLVFVPN